MAPRHDVNARGRRSLALDLKAAAGRDGGNQRGKERPPEVIGDDHEIELTAAKRPGRRLDVCRDDLRHVVQRTRGGGIPVDAGHLHPLLGEPAHMTT